MPQSPTCNQASKQTPRPAWSPGHHSQAQSGLAPAACMANPIAIVTDAHGAARPAPLACDGCRRKHLKCDGASPACGRCLVDGLACSYTPSRRGLKHRSSRRRDLAHATASAHQPRSPRPLHAAAGTDTITVAPPTPPTSAPTQYSGSHAHHHHDALPDNSAIAAPAPPDSITISGSLDDQRLPFPSFDLPPPSTWTLNSSHRDRLLNLFYTHFFAAHPFLVPRPWYATQRYPAYLDLVVCFAGQHYATTMSEASALQDAVSSAMTEPDEQTPSRVQALVLYAIILHACQQPREAVACIARAASIALHLGMNEPTFAREKSAGSPLVEESMRRTWWELYTVDIYFAAIHRLPTHHTASAKPLPFLPCAQVEYEAGRCDPNPATLAAFEDRVFSPQPQASYASLCFRIDAIRLVGRIVITASQDDACSDSIQALDNALAGWDYNLPFACRDVVSPSGDVELMLFESRCFIACASIFLHFPRSGLPDRIPSAKDLACAKNYTQLAPASRYHTVKAVAASKDLANLATVPWPLDRHSPFFVCGLVLGCIIQLAAVSIHVHRDGLNSLQQHRDRVGLMLGALHRLGERWALAQNAAQCLKVIAETILLTYDGHNTWSPRAPSFQDSAMADSDIMGTNSSWFDLFSMDEMPSDFFNNIL